MRKILESCPTCNGPLEISEVHCTRCETRVRARYRPCDFCRLSEEQNTFLRLFVACRGNLTEVEKRLGVSYPTIRAKLDEVIERLDTEEEPITPSEPTERRTILEAVNQGRLSVGEALERIRALR